LILFDYVQHIEDTFGGSNFSKYIIGNNAKVVCYIVELISFTLNFYTVELILRF